MTPLSGLPDTAVIPGRGTVTVVGRAVVVAPASPSRAVLQEIGAVDAELHPAAAIARIAELVHAAPGMGVAVGSAAGWLVAAGAGVQLHADHVGFRRVHTGPVAHTVVGATRLTMGTAAAGAVDARAVGATAHGTRSGSGVVIAVEEVLGTPALAVEGVLCTCQAFVHPLSVHCAACGRLIAAPRQLACQPGVPVGRIVLDDGRTMALAGTVVIGRDPASAPVAGEEEATGLVLTDAQRSVSRSHVVLSVEGWDVVLRDNHAANGTSVRPSSSGDWTQLAPGAAVRLLPSTEVQLGRRTIRLIG